MTNGALLPHLIPSKLGNKCLSLPCMLILCRPAEIWVYWLLLYGYIVLAALCAFIVFISKEKLKGRDLKKNLRIAFYLFFQIFRLVFCSRHELLTFIRLMTYIYVVSHRWPPDVAYYIFIQQIYVQNILNMLHILRFFFLLQNAVYFTMLPFF